MGITAELSPFKERCLAKRDREVAANIVKNFMANRIIPEPYFTYSRQLRKNQTPVEAKLWARLRVGRFFGLKFKRQVQIGQYIYDFSCRGKMVLIELDGGQHMEQKVANNDGYKKSFAEQKGYKLLRFWNNEMDDNLEGVLEVIKRVCGV